MNDNQLKVLAARVIFFWLLLDLQSVLLRYVVVIVVHLGQVIFFVILNLKRLSMHLAKNNSLRLSISAASAVRVAAAHTLTLLRLSPPPPPSPPCARRMAKASRSGRWGAVS